MVLLTDLEASATVSLAFLSRAITSKRGRSLTPQSPHPARAWLIFPSMIRSLSGVIVSEKNFSEPLSSLIVFFGLYLSTTRRTEALSALDKF